MARRIVFEFERFTLVALVVPIPAAFLLVWMGPSWVTLVVALAGIPAAAIVSWIASIRIADRAAQPWGYITFLTVLAVWVGAYLLYMGTMISGSK